MGVIEGVKVELDGVTMPTDFVIIESPPQALGAKGKDTMLLGRPFVKVTRMIIDIYSRTCTYEVQGKQRKLHAYSDPILTAARDRLKEYMGAYTGPLYIYSHLHGRKGTRKVGRPLGAK